MELAYTKENNGMPLTKQLEELGNMKNTNTAHRAHFGASASYSVASASSSAAPVSVAAPAGPASVAALAALASAAQMATSVDVSDAKLWPDNVIKAFIDIMVDEVTKGNMPNGVFHLRTWNSMTTRLNSVTNRSFTVRQLKAKMHRLRAIMYREFYSLSQNTGFGWNAETNTVTANEEVWRNYLHVHNKAAQFQKKSVEATSRVTLDCSIAKCVAAPEELEGISDDASGKALEKIISPDWREVFIAMSNERKRGWVLRL
ncbi:L10-interacting MYB domain-containing protein-like isoform X1 [Trifolium pratense]|uniref:L10-interacting MYB domain-containing protein-like isoform X1 n=2 Tax=Trifolium pratense TaxID=57577 RepID=UPI001E694007|nr:L10-interacting MYB domain-containing protein-like isoform X1 [Trifolium pratense]